MRKRKPPTATPAPTPAVPTETQTELRACPRCGKLEHLRPFVMYSKWGTDHGAECSSHHGGCGFALSLKPDPDNWKENWNERLRELSL